MRSSFAPGKIILSGEYAVVFGYFGLAVSSSIGIEAAFENDDSEPQIEIIWRGAKETHINYAKKIAALCEKDARKFRGRLVINSNLPVGKGMGSSTALIIAVSRALLGENAKENARLIEDTLNPGNSGLDFTTIWENAPILYCKSADAKIISLPSDLLREAVLIDTGLPDETTSELVAWMQRRKSEVLNELEIIDECTKRLVAGDSLPAVMREHNKAQVALGVVPPRVAKMIAEIESAGGAAKVIGAGGRAGGAGMVLALGDKTWIRKIASRENMPVTLL